VSGSVMERLWERLTEYQSALADLDFETGAGWFRLDQARDELLGALGLFPGADEPLIVPLLLAVVEAAREVSQLERTGVLPDFRPLAEALDALDATGEDG
jgi:hypothetical protein